ncbi:MAG TPA: trypsin-like peptidase domain-containing protein [Steroidobacteraceae bacterium]|nr:trypsin-like peptidase domain-containing protein [Steroidobacteraceae bacterium]
MPYSPFARTIAFVVGSAVVGLAAAFLLVAFRPELVAGRLSAPTEPIRASREAVANEPSAQSDSDAATATSEPNAGRAPGASQDQPPVPGRPVGGGVVSYADAVDRAAPAVVNIYTARVVTERIRPSPIEELFGDATPRYRQRVERSLGSGVILDAAGHIVTNHHVIATADAVRVQLADGRAADATIVGRDPDTDLAVLKIDLPRLPVMPLGRSNQLRVGDVVLTIGNPVGLSQTVTQGIVSATGRGQLGVATFENFIQTDAPINAGNSGGALINTSGELIGINTAVLAKNLGVEGIGFAIPVNLARSVMDELLKNGRVIRGWIGIIPQDIDARDAQQLGLARGGVVIANMYVASPAATAGMRPGDLLLAIDGREVRNAQDFTARVAEALPGKTIEVKALRGTEEFTAKLVSTEKPRAQ